MRRKRVLSVVMAVVLLFSVAGGAAAQETAMPTTTDTAVEVTDTESLDDGFVTYDLVMVAAIGLLLWWRIG